MKLSFELTEQDVFEFYKFDAWVSPDKKSYRIKSRLSYAAFLALLPFTAFLDIDFSVDTLLTASFPVLGAFTFGLFACKPIKLALLERQVVKLFINGKNQNMIEPRTIEFNNGVIECKSRTSESKIELNSIEKIRQDENYIYIYVNTISGIIIPKRVFNSGSELKQLENFLDINVVGR